MARSGTWRRQGLRFAVTVFCAAFALGLLPEAWRGRGIEALPRLSPLLAFCGTLATRACGAAVLLGVPLLAWAFFRGRGFCWWLCPMGFLAESAGRLTPRGARFLKRVPAVNRALAAVVVASSACGYPLFVWLDPLSVFNGFWAAWREPLTFASAAIGAVFAGVMLLAVVLPNAWCHRLCPLGGLQEIAAALGRATRDRLARRAAGTRGASDATAVSRRAVLAAVPAAVAALAARKAAGNSGARAIRPPGADPLRINAMCARCGNCMRACPYGLIRPDLGRTGLDGLLSPVVRFRSQTPDWNPDDDRYCFQDCTACTLVCPTGALKPLTAEGKKKHPIGRAEVLKDKCLAWKKGEYCVVCDEYCPYKAVTFDVRNGINCPVVDPDRCRGCGACEGACPADPVAIVVRPLGEPPPPPDEIVVYTRWRFVRNPETGEVAPEGAYRHEATDVGAERVARHFRANGLRCRVTDDPRVFEPGRLASVRGVAFLNTNHEQFETDEQRNAFYGWARAGGAVLAVHSASGNERGRPEWRAFLGGSFRGHYRRRQPVPFRRADRTHPALAAFPPDYVWADDEIYFNDPLDSVRPLLTLDWEDVLDASRREEPRERPKRGGYVLEWCKSFGSGRVYYTALGHNPQDFGKPEFLDHLLAAMKWCLGRS